MLVVLGSAVAAEGRFAELLAISREHVARSRAEPGCISHAVHQDTENPLRLVFVEEWQDLASLQQHFKVPASRTFGKALAGLTSSPPTLAVYEARPVKV
ncbi:MAG: putative quinol monooxygenase [Rubrivivax sp.]